MKNLFISALALFILLPAGLAQSGGILWVGSRSANAHANAVHAAISGAYEAFIAGDDAKAWSYYSNDIAEIDPMGGIVFGKSAILANWNAFMGMADEAPKFSYSNVQVRMLTDDVAIAVWDSEADIKVGGQQMGGKSKGSAVLRKISDQWKIEFDQLTPVIPMPEK